MYNFYKILKLPLSIDVNGEVVQILSKNLANCLNLCRSKFYETINHLTFKDTMRIYYVCKLYRTHVSCKREVFVISDVVELFSVPA